MSTNRAKFEQALHQGHLYSWDQRWEDAIRAFYAALKASGEEPAAYAGLGMAYLELGQLPEALENYILAARFSNGDIIYLRQVADVQERMGYKIDAGKTYQAMGEQALNQQHLMDAVEFWHQATRLAPDLPRPHQRLAAYYERQGVTLNAIREYLALANILLKQGKPDRAEQACRLALQLDPQNADVLTAIELIRQGKKSLAVSDAPTTKSAAVNRMAQAAESRPVSAETSTWDGDTAVPVQDARQIALAELAQQMFTDQDDPAQLQRVGLITKALDYQTRHLSNEAISTYEEAIRQGENSSAVHFNLATLYQDKLRFDDAIRQYKLTIHSPKYQLASHFGLGECYRARGRLGDAIQHFISVLKILDLGTVQRDQADDLIELYENLSNSLLTHGEPEEASDFANALVKFLNQKGWEDKVKLARQRLNAISSPSMMILGDVLTTGTEQVLESLYLSQEYARRGLYNAATEETYRAIQLAPDYMPAHMRLAELLADQGRREAAALKYVTIADAYRARSEINSAIYAYEQGAELAPQDVSIRARLINLLRQYGQIDRALAYYLSMGEAYAASNQGTKALETYENGLRLAPRGQQPEEWQVKLLTAKADLHQQRFEWREALEAYKQLHELRPKDDAYALTLVDLYYRVGQPNNAVRTLDHYLMQLARSGNSAEVKTTLEEMVRQRPKDSALVFRLSRLYSSQKRNDQAVALLDQLGEAQLAAGETTQAIVTIERILALNPSNRASYSQLLTQLRQS